MLVPVSQSLCICHKGTTLCLQLTVPVINDALHILSLAQHAQQVSMILGARGTSDDPCNVHLSEGASMLDSQEGESRLVLMTIRSIDSNVQQGLGARIVFHLDL